MPNETNYPFSWNQEYNASYYQYARPTHNSNMHDLLYATQSHKSPTILSPNLYATYINQFETQNFIEDLDKPPKSCALSTDNNRDESYENLNNVNTINTDLYKSNCLKDVQDLTGVNCSYSYPSCSQMLQNPADLYYGNAQHDASTYEIYDHMNATYNTNCCMQAPAITNNYEYQSNTNVDVTDSESDIVVEESEEIVTDYSEDFEEINYTSCIICNTMYSGNRFHLITPTTPLTVTSQVTIFSKIIEFVGHLNNNQYYLCNHCLGLINTIDQLQNKIEIYKNELVRNFSKSGTPPQIKVKCAHSINCNLCRKTFSLKKIYRAHLLNHSLKRNYLCELCGKCFLKYSKFKLHYKIHKVPNCNVAPKKINAFTCRVCKKPLRTRTHLKEHENYCTGKLPFKCPNLNCNKKFATSTKLKDHIKLKHEKKFTSICSICNIGFVKPSDYKSHMTSHSTEKKYNCTLCDKSYKTLSNLNFHIKFHSKKLPYVCEICNKGFMRKEYLESHVNLHKGIKNFACHLCEKKFVSQKNLDAHVKYHDGSLKKKSCDICGKFMSSGLEDHIRSHNNLKEFQCGVCKMKFNTKGALAKHKKRKHETVL